MERKTLAGSMVTLTEPGTRNGSLSSSSLAAAITLGGGIGTAR